MIPKYDGSCRSQGEAADPSGSSQPLLGRRCVVLLCNPILLTFVQMHHASARHTYQNLAGMHHAVSVLVRPARA